MTSVSGIYMHVNTAFDVAQTALSSYNNFFKLSTQGGGTPLMTASFNGHVDVVKLLIEAKCSIDARIEV